jgi:hypothetical protein
MMQKGFPGQTAESFGYRGILINFCVAKRYFLFIFLAFKSSYFKGYLECSGISFFSVFL